MNASMLAGNAVATAAASTVTIVVEDDAVSVVHTPPPLVNRTFFVYFSFNISLTKQLNDSFKKNIDTTLTPQPVNAGDAAHVTTPPELVLGVSDLVCKLSGSGQ